MKIQLIMTLLFGIVIGAAVSSLVTTRVLTSRYEVQSKQNNHVMEHQMTPKDSDMSMAQMTDSLSNKTGDDFDKAFLKDMIIHHEGAIDMAKLVQKNAKHEQLHEMAENIISAQSAEILQMHQWQKEWNY